MALLPITDKIDWILLIEASLSVKQLIVELDGIDKSVKKIDINSALVEDAYCEISHLNIIDVFVLI